MSKFLLTPIAIGYLANLVLISLAVGYLWRSQRLQPGSLSQKYLFGLFSSMAAFAALALGQEAMTGAPSLYCHYGLNLPLALAQWFGFHFIYLFPKPDSRFRREARVVSWFNLAIIGFELWFLGVRFHALWARGRVLWRPPWIGWLMALSFAWMVGVLLRKAANEAARDGRARSWMSRVVKPGGRGDRAAGGMALVMAFAAVVVMVSGLGLRKDMLDLSISLGVLAAIYFFVLLYLNVSAPSVSLRVRLVGVALSTSLAVLTLIHWTVVSLYLHERAANLAPVSPPLRPLTPGNQSFRFVPDAAGGYDLMAVAPHFDGASARRLKCGRDPGPEVTLPFAFPYFGQPRLKARISLNGAVSFGPEAPFVQDFCYRYGCRPAILAGLAEFQTPDPRGPGGVYFDALDDRVVITWRKLRLNRRPEGENTFQMVLHRGGGIDFNYLEIQAESLLQFARSANEGWMVGLLPGGPAQWPAERLFTDGSLSQRLHVGPEGIVEDSVLEWRRILHPLSLRMCVITLLVSIAVVFGFPLVINAMLIQPIARLVAGVRRVNEGALDVSVQVSHPDEIGYLTKSFNGMVTSIRLAATELSRHRDNLEELVRARTEALREEIRAKEVMAEELERARCAAESANKAKSAFLAGVSHEIRTPMNGVIGMTSLLLQTPLKSEQRHYAETIRHSSEALLTIVNDILDISKIEAGKLDLEEARFDLRACFEEPVELMSAGAAEKRLEMTCQVEDSLPAWAKGDATRLRQVMLNLLGNALKFTERGEIWVRVGRLAATGTGGETPGGAIQIECSVGDTGVGIPNAAMGRLFQPFSQLDTSSKRKHGGTGLGLAISKRLVEAMGGRIWAEGREGGGTVFHFTVALKSEESTPPSWAVGGGTLAGRRFLVVQRHLASRELILHYLRLWGASAEGCSNLEECLRLLDARPQWDGVLVDEGDLGGTTNGPAEVLYPRMAETGAALGCMVWRDLSGGRLSRLPPNARILRKPLRPAQLLEEVAAMVSSGALIRGGASSTVEEAVPVDSPLWVMVADDNEVNLKVVTSYLHLLGCRTLVARNGREVLDMAGRQPFDLVLMDVQMPEMDGLEASRELARRFSPTDMPLIIGLSAGVSQTEREACFEAGMVDFLSKPLRLSDLRAGLERWREWLGDGLGRGAGREEGGGLANTHPPGA